MDEIALVAPSAALLQAALNCTSAWAYRWRLAFGRGAHKSAVMQCPRGPRSGVSPLWLGCQPLPWVEEYRYLGILIDRGLTLKSHIRERGAKAQAAFFACCGWAHRERVPVSTVVRFFQVHVLPVALWGVELAAFSDCRMRELDSWQRRLGRWLLRDHRAPSAIVLGDLGWWPWSSLALERAVSLWCRLRQLGAPRPSVAIADASGSAALGWARAVSLALDYLGAPLPVADVAMRGPTGRRQYLQRSVRPLLAARDCRQWRASMQGYQDPALVEYAQCVTAPALAPPHSSPAPPAHASAWCRIRHGGSTLPSHRAGRHRSSGVCSLCGSASGSTAHAILECTALAERRSLWWERVRACAPWLELPVSCSQAVLRWFFGPCTMPAVAAAHAAFAYAVEFAYADARPRRGPCGGC